MEKTSPGSDFLRRYVDPLDHLGLRRDRLPAIPPNERLVPVDFCYDRPALVTEVLQAMKDRANFAGYPANGLHWSESEYDRWVFLGRPVEALVGKPGDRPPYFVGEHSNRNSKNPAIEKYAADGTIVPRPERFAGLTLASDGSPIHPFFHEAVMSPEGIVTGPGFYWFLGENGAADPVFVRTFGGKLQFALIDRGDLGGIALPGGMLDIKKRKGWVRGGAVAAMGKAIDEAKRELAEETGMNIESVTDILGIPILEKVIVGDFRMTAQAFPVTSVYMFIPNPATAEILVPKAGDDAAGAMWAGAGGQALWKGADSWLWEGVAKGKMFASHASYIKLAILEFERQFRVVVGADGTIGKAP